MLYEVITRFNPETLPVNARRRITPAIRIAMQAAAEAIRASALDAASVATVFVTSNGDLDISDRICKALTLSERPVPSAAGIGRAKGLSKNSVKRLNQPRRRHPSWTTVCR